MLDEAPQGFCKGRRESPKRVLRLPDLAHARTISSIIYSISPPSSLRRRESPHMVKRLNAALRQIDVVNYFHRDRRTEVRPPSHGPTQVPLAHRTRRLPRSRKARARECPHVPRDPGLLIFAKRNVSKGSAPEIRITENWYEELREREQANERIRKGLGVNRMIPVVKSRWLE